MEPKYAQMPISKSWEGTNDLRQVANASGFIGIQRLWRCRETGETSWKFLPSVPDADVP